MKDISSVILNFIDETMTNKGLTLYDAGSGKYIAMDAEFDTHFKFDLSFSENAFICLVLVQGTNELIPAHTFNISWTNGRALRDFFSCIEKLNKEQYI